jgi:hypothetical protein
MQDEPEPPRKVYGFKPRAFERTNDPPPDAPPPPPLAPDPGIVPASEGRIDVQDLIRSATGSVPLLGSNKVLNRDNDVHGLLRENHAHAEAAGLNRLKPQPPRRSRRTRDYLVLVVFVNLFIATLYSAEIFIGFQVQCLAAKMPQEFGNLVRYALHNPVVYAMPLFGMFTLTFAITWLMFGMMDDY